MTQQLSLFQQYAYHIRNSESGIYRLSLFLNGDKICEFMSLDMALAFVKHRLSELQLCYKDKRAIIEEVLNDYRIYDDKLNMHQKLK